MATILRLNKSLLGQMLDVHGPAFIVNNFWEFPSIWDGRHSYTIWKHRNNKNVRTRLIGLLNECDIFRHDKKVLRCVQNFFIGSVNDLAKPK